MFVKVYETRTCRRWLCSCGASNPIDASTCSVCHEWRGMLSQEVLGERNR